MTSVDFFLSNADKRRAARGNFRTQKLPGLFFLSPRPARQAGSLESNHRIYSEKRFLLLLLFCVVYFPLQAAKISEKWLKKRIRGMTWEYAPSCLLNPSNLRRSLTPTNLGLPAFSPSPQSYMQEANLALIMWTTSSHGLWELSDHICWTARPKTPTPQGCCLLCPFGHR